VTYSSFVSQLVKRLAELRKPPCL